MIATIKVGPLSDDESISFGSVPLEHIECGGNVVRAHRNPADGGYTLHCACGLEIVLTTDGDAVRRIERMAIGDEGIALEPLSYSSNQGLVTLKPVSG